MIVASAQSVDVVAQAAPRESKVVVATGSFAELCERQSDASPTTRPSAEDGATLLYTSGTTGDPKGVSMSHRTSGASGKHFISALGIRESDTLLAVTPLFHGNAWGALITALRAGATVAFPASFHASEFWPLVHRSGATVLYTLGTILAMLLTREPSELERRNPLRVILGLGSAPVRDRVLSRFGVEHVAECFGSTDAGVVTITPLGEPMRRGSCGPPVAGVEIRIADDAGRPLGAGEVGEITVRSPYRMTAYFRDPEQTREALRGDWFLTGDLGYLDGDGWLYFVDRKKDVIRRGSVRRQSRRHRRGRGRGGDAQSRSQARSPRTDRICTGQPGLFHGSTLRGVRAGASVHADRKGREVQAAWRTGTAGQAIARMRETAMRHPKPWGIDDMQRFSSGSQG